jgi:hypothetical protein
VKQGNASGWIRENFEESVTSSLILAFLHQRHVATYNTLAVTAPVVAVVDVAVPGIV